jgi:hypothetical protein
MVIAPPTRYPSSLSIITMENHQLFNGVILPVIWGYTTHYPNTVMIIMMIISKFTISQIIIVLC